MKSTLVHCYCFSLFDPGPTFLIALLLALYCYILIVVADRLRPFRPVIVLLLARYCHSVPKAEVGLYLVLFH